MAADQVTVTVKIVRSGRTSNVTLVRPLVLGGNPTKHRNQTRRLGTDTLSAAVAALMFDNQED